MRSNLWWFQVINILQRQHDRGTHGCPVTIAVLRLGKISSSAGMTWWLETSPLRWLMGTLATLTGVLFYTLYDVTVCHSCVHVTTFAPNLYDQSIGDIAKKTLLFTRAITSTMDSWAHHRHAARGLWLLICGWFFFPDSCRRLQKAWICTGKKDDEPWKLAGFPKMSKDVIICR